MSLIPRRLACMARYVIKSLIGRNPFGVTGILKMILSVVSGLLMAGMKSGVNGMAVSVGTITDPGRAKKISVCVISLTSAFSML